MAIAWPSGDTGKEAGNYRDYIGYSGHCLALRRSVDAGKGCCGSGIVG